jgi:hypothetical protein
MALLPLYVPSVKAAQTGDVSTHKEIEIGDEPS